MLHDQAFSNFQHKSQDTDPPNPFAVTYSSEPLWDLQSDVLLKDENPEDIIAKRGRTVDDLAQELGIEPWEAYGALDHLRRTTSQVRVATDREGVDLRYVRRE